MASDEMNEQTDIIAARVADQAVYSGDVAGRIDLSVQIGEAGIELTRLSGSEGRKGIG